MKNLQKKLRIITFILIAGLLFSSVTIPVDAFIQKKGTMNEAVTLRQNADASSAQVMQLTNGQAVTVNNELTASDGSKWYQVFVNDTTIGYVPTSAVTLGSSSAADTGTQSSGTTGGTSSMQTITITERIATVTVTSAVRVRAQATTSSEHIASLEPNDTCLVLEDTKAADGYVWYKVQFDDNGREVNGFVRSDLVTVKEVTREEQIPVENPQPDTPPVTDQPADAPYSITSEVNAEGTTVWSLIDNKTGDKKDIATLLKPVDTKAGGNTGIYKGVVVVLLILVIAAAGAATFFYMRWQDAEEFIFELREKQVRAQKQPNQNRTAPKKQTTTPPAGNKNTKPTGNMASKLPPINVDAVQTTAKPAQTQASTKPVETPAPAVPSQPAAKSVVKPEEKTVVQSAAKAEPKQEKKDVTPNTADIVNATKKELQSKQSAPAQKSNSWKSKNFLTDDDDLEFDFLDMDEKK